MVTLTVGPEGEITLPQELLDHLDMPNGGLVEAIPQGDCSIIMRRADEQQADEGELGPKRSE